MFFLRFSNNIINLSKLITFINDKEQNISVGLFYISILCLSSIIQTLIAQHYYQSTFIMGNRMKLSLINVIYKKVIKNN